MTSQHYKFKLFCIALLLTLCFISTFVFAQTRQPAQPTRPAQPAAPPRPPQVTLTRTYVPLDCSVVVTQDSLVTFHYSAHLVTAQRTVGDLFDETVDYAPLTLRANPRHMLSALSTGMQGACIDERRTVVIPHQFASFESLPKNTDIVFFVHVISIEPYSDIFEIIDKDGDNQITTAEFAAYVRSTGRVLETLTEATARRLMRQNDLNKDGVVTCPELSHTSKLGYCDAHKPSTTHSTAVVDEFDKFFNTYLNEHDALAASGF